MLFSRILARFLMFNILGGVGVVNTLDLDQAGLGTVGVTATLVAQVASPTDSMVSESSL